MGAKNSLISLSPVTPDLLCITTPFRQNEQYILQILTKSFEAKPAFI